MPIITSMNDEDLLKCYITEAIAMGSQYQRKEELRQRLQDMLEEAIDHGEIRSQEQLADWWNTIDMASGALRGVPYEIWKRKLGK